jgi:hypothetical protein
MSDELKTLLREDFECAMTDIQICLPGVIEKYDPKTRRADIQPSLKRKMPGGKFMDLSVIPDVPVRFSGSRKYTIHFPLEKGEEVALHFIQRSTDVWRDNGGKGIEDTDPRRFDFCDCYAVPGLQPQEFIDVTKDNLESGLAVIHKTAWDGDLIESVLINDEKIEVVRKEQTKDNYFFTVDKDHMQTVFKKDEKLIAQMTVDDTKAETLYKDISIAVMEDADITVKYKEKCQVKMEDDHLTANTEKCMVEMAADVLTAKNSQLAMKMNGAKASLKNSSKNLFTIIDTFLNILKTTKPTTLGSPAQHTWNPVIDTAISTAQTDFGSILEA